MVDITSITLAELSAAEGALRQVQPDAAALSAEVDKDGMDLMAWGLTGAATFATGYFSMIGELRSLFQMMADGIEGHAERLEACRTDWANADDEMATAFHKLAPEGLGESFNVVGTTFNYSSAGDTIRTDSWKSVTGPSFYNNAANGVDAVKEVVRAQDGASSVMGGLGDLSNSVFQIGGDIGTFFENPLSLLLQNGMEFLIKLIKPVDDLIGMVTGNPSRMGDEIKRWQDIRAKMHPVGEGIAAIPEGALRQWTGKDGDAAREKIAEFAEGVFELADRTIILESLLRLCEALATAIQKWLISLVSDWCVNEIMAWLIALASSVATFGASAASAMVRSVINALATIGKAIKKVYDVMKTFAQTNKIMKPVLEVMGKVSGPWAEAGVKTVGTVGRLMGTGGGGPTSISDAFTQ
ncbi:hypothetical protein [Glycomyces harbinensis]|uniref:Uncharacterized protein n=1 Tax=Glycomyces harbinensis TaxID=58114 RepID=A0A1G6Y4L9_9ACTN|nr:hypothetical protein [Glycomyces harbinensis]SDD84555.1 hypothetical protein SAMN05216270_10894 [Glycomyces harbinensis]